MVLNNMQLQWKLIFFLAVLSLGSCQKKEVRFVVSEHDENYKEFAYYLETVLSRASIGIEVLEVDNSLAAAKMVANNEADLCLLMNHTNLIDQMENEVSDLRMLFPVFNRVVYTFHRRDRSPESMFELVDGKKIHVGASTGERYSNFAKIMQLTGWNNYEIVTDTSEADVIFFWGDTNARRAEELLDKGWRLYSMDPLVSEAFSIKLGKIKPIDIPALRRTRTFRKISTFTSDAVLLSNEFSDEDLIYELCSIIFDDKLWLESKNIIYSNLSEQFDIDLMSFPMHTGAERYFNRNEPTFWERYAEIIALVVSVLVLSFGVIRSIQSYMSRRKKERIDKYFDRYLALKEEKPDDYRERLYELLNRSIKQMVSEKLDKQDFDIFARLIYAELSSLV